jgi:hypothetical protein
VGNAGIGGRWGMRNWREMAGMRNRRRWGMRNRREVGNAE